MQDNPNATATNNQYQCILYAFFQFHILISVYVMMCFIFQDRIVHFLIETVYDLAPLEF